MQRMNPDELQLRRATVDDVESLMHLWFQNGLPAEDLEHRLTEFQVAQDAEGQIVATMGLKRVAQQGSIHNEAYLDPDDVDQLRSVLWEHVLKVARNSGLVRLWINDDASFWKQRDFVEATSEDLEKLPPGFGDWKASWLTLKLRDDLAAMDRLEKEIQMYRLTSQQNTERLLQRAKILKLIAGVIAAAAIVLILLALFYALTHSQR